MRRRIKRMESNVRKTRLTPRAVVGYMVNKTGLSKFELSKRLGKSATYINRYTTDGSIPSLNNLEIIAAECGYEIHLIGHDEDILVVSK